MQFLLFFTFYLDVASAFCVAYLCIRKFLGTVFKSGKFECPVQNERIYPVPSSPTWGVPYGVRASGCRPRGRRCPRWARR